MSIKLQLCSLVVLLCVQLSLQAAAPACPEMWDSYKGSCYLFGTQFTGQSWYAAAGSCKAFNAHLVEFDDQAEFDFITGKTKEKHWTTGPWIGMVRLGGDNLWTFPQGRSSKKSNDATFNKMVDNEARKATFDCGGLNKNGGGFGFWQCTNLGSPICEYEVTPTV